jgi:hypothetical protein
MERIIVNYKDGNIKEFQEPSGQIISGDSLIITTKKAISDENSDDAHIATTSEVISLSLVKNFIKISSTRKVNIEEYVSNK